ESEQMVKTFPFLCRFRCLLRWEHFSYIHSNFRSVNHFSFCCSWMDAIAVDSDFCRRSVEAFMLQFTKRAAVDCISYSCPEIVYGKFMRASANFFILCKSDGYRYMIELRMFF